MGDVTTFSKSRLASGFLACWMLLSVGCTVERHLYSFDLLAAVEDDDPPEQAVYTVVLSWETIDGLTDGDCVRYNRVIAETALDEPGTVTLSGDFEADECDGLVDFHLGVWRDDDGDGEFAGQWVEPCGAVIIDEPYERDEPIPLVVALGGCQAISMRGGQVPMACCQTP